MQQVKRKVKNWRYGTVEEKIIPHQMLIRMFELVRLLHKKPQSLLDIAQRFKVTDRSANRYIHMLEALEVKVERKGNLFFVRKKNCPLCKLK